MSATQDNHAANQEARARRATRLGFGMKSLYGTGSFVDSVTGTALNTFLLFYLTAVVGLPGSLAGLASGIALIVDAFADPFIGSVSDSTWTKWGRRHPYMFVSTVPVAISLGLLFSIPTGLDGLGLFLYVTVVLLVLRFSISLYNLPYTALTAEYSDDYSERSNIVAWRTFYSIIAQLAVIILGLGFFFKGVNGTLVRSSYAPFGWTCAVITATFALLCAFGTLSTIDRVHKVSANLDGLLRRFLGEVVDIFRNHSFRVLFFAALIFFTAAGTSTALGLHINTFFWGMPSNVILGTQLSYLLGFFIGIPSAAIVSRALEKRSVVIVGLLLVSACLFFAPVLRIAGILPPNGTALYAGLIVNSGFVGVGVALVSIAFQSMMADAADEHEDLFGGRREGLYFAGLGFSAKAASGLGTVIAGDLLQLIHFPSDLAAHGGTALHLAADVVRNLGWTGAGTAALLAVSAACVGYWRIDRAAYTRIQENLSAKRQD